MPAGRIWHRRSFRHSVCMIFHILNTSSNALALVDQRNQDRNTAASALVIRKAWAVVAKMVLGHASELKDNDALPPEAQ